MGYNERMSIASRLENDDPAPRQYYTIGELARMLGWGRTNTYYWLSKLNIPIANIAGHKFVPITDLTRVILTLRQAKKEALERRISAKDKQ